MVVTSSEKRTTTNDMFVSTDRSLEPKMRSGWHLWAFAATAALFAALPAIGIAFDSMFSTELFFPAGIFFGGFGCWALRAFVMQLIVFHQDGVMLYGKVYGWHQIRSVQTMKIQDGYAVLIATHDGRLVPTSCLDSKEQLESRYKQISSDETNSDMYRLKRKVKAALWAPTLLWSLAAACIIIFQLLAG